MTNLNMEARKKPHSQTPRMLKLRTYDPSPSGTLLSSVQNEVPVIQLQGDNVESAAANLNHIFASKKPVSEVGYPLGGTSTYNANKAKSRKVGISFANTTQALCKDASMYLYKTNERIHLKLPHIVREKRELRSIVEAINIADSDLRDGAVALDALRSMENMKSTIDLAQRTIELMEHINETSPR
ncbi:hypothetical protein K493DRAFT_345106 [Basidiobolus meristosporus CBS 931.73]|uniref:Uncharacterized protein n=1 Tax=Basidiobolus meristosporus CBS 931.73 TaxID=1314790 RepID=A0A1Y1Z555_9FUNG|nr:hypothetical protein K493DRAFT_345106 [Basidiobolus meristosporus CBS 931.73]|eukprot:ORY05346.1 hypothetical protein K493DRAFT_345106 [Basidiobolus meristosporus CBS 931.73]